jgi:glucose-1-phosphate cytidylyltransferase
MKTVILCGGLGTRLSEETNQIPKPMVKIGDKPILFHIMNYFSYSNYNEFILCAGYKSVEIKKYFLEYNLEKQNIYLDLKKKKTTIEKKYFPNWKINIVQTGELSQTAARIKKIKKYIKNDNDFFMTYGDGLSNVDLKKLLKFHKSHGKIATVTACRPIARFGNITLVGDKVLKFIEKDHLSEGWVNGGFFVLNKKIFDYIDNNEQRIFEREPLENLAKEGQLMAYKHEGFWHPMDTLRDKNILSELTKKNIAPWIKN